MGFQVRLLAALRVRLLVVVFAACSAGCAPSAGDPAAEVAALIASGEAAAEAGDHRAISELLADDYDDAAGRDRRQVAFMLRSLMGRYPNVMISVRDIDVDVISPELANADATVLLLARRQGGALPFGVDGDAFRLRLALRREGGDWLVTRAQWGDSGAGN